MDCVPWCVNIGKNLNSEQGHGWKGGIDDKNSATLLYSLHTSENIKRVNPNALETLIPVIF